MPRKKTVKTEVASMKITDFYPVRRSCRRPESEIKKEKLYEMEEKVLTDEESGLLVCHIVGKGRGVLAARDFEKGEFVVEYRGELIDTNTAIQREELYNKDSSVGCYMYYFNYKNKSYCVDATEETKYLGRLVNHCAKDPNCITKAVEVNGVPHLILVAARRIRQGEELLYDYGDRRRDALESHPWLKF